MKGVICYYSATGNTELACKYMAEHIKSIFFELLDITKISDTNLASYDIVGFAVPADFWGPPYLMKTFIEKLPTQTDKPAFLFNTYGLISGKTLLILKDWVHARGFKVVAGYSLRTPENYPPLIVKGITSENAPKQKDMEKFNNFIRELDSFSLSTPCQKPALKIGLINSLLPTRSRTTAKHDMCEKYVDSSRCNECGVCQNGCPYGAIRLNPTPVFDMEKCYGCWSCFNHCPNKAIYTVKIRGKGHYPKPLKILEQKLK